MELAPGAQDRAGLDYTTPEVLRKLGDSGFFALTIPTEFGGEPKDCVTIGIAFEEICAVDFSAFSFMLSHVLMPLMLEWANKDVRAEWIPALGRGEKLVCFANTEPDCGSDASAITTRAVRDGDYYIISGEKTSISGGMQADAVLLTAKTNPDAGVKGVTCFFLPLDLPGVSRSRFYDMGAEPSGRASLFFNDVRVSAKHRVGAEGEGFTKILSSFDFARVLVALSGVGMADQSLAEVTEYIKERTVFGNTLSRFEGIIFKLAEIATFIETSRLICYKALNLRDEGLPHSKEVAMAKWYTTTYVTRSIHDILLIFGHRGYCEALPIEQRFRNAMSLRIGDGTAEIMKLIIARELVGEKIIPF
jgi:cyclohexanecarboxyl-CoA dehydrogenase